MPNFFAVQCMFLYICLAFAMSPVFSKGKVSIDKKFGDKAVAFIINLKVFSHRAFIQRLNLFKKITFIKSLSTIM